ILSEDAPSILTQNVPRLAASAARRQRAVGGWRGMLRAMARSTIHYLRKRGLTRTAIAGHVGCERHTVARVLAQPVDHRYARPPRSSPWAHWEPAVVGWLEADLPVKRMLELARADATTPYTASAASWYRFVAGLKRVRAAAAAVEPGVCPLCRRARLPSRALRSPRPAAEGDRRELSQVCEDELPARADLRRRRRSWRAERRLVCAEERRGLAGAPADPAGAP